MSLTREECKDVIAKCLEGDSESFEIFYNQFHRLVHEHARKWHFSIQRISLGLYDYEDVYQELWLHLLRKLPTYDPERSNPVTWMYLILSSGAGMIYRSYNNLSRSPSEEQKLIYLDNTISDSDGKEMQMLDLIIDPSGAVENQFIDENQVFTYTYLLSKLIPKLNETQKICYLHSIKGIDQRTTANILGLSQSYISRLTKSTVTKAMKAWNRIENNNVDVNDMYNLSFELLSLKSDDDLHQELGLDLGVIKICREILSLANLY